MSMTPDINDNELWIAEATLQKRYEAQFFYREPEQYGTKVVEHNNLAQHVLSILQTQADYARAVSVSAQSSS